MSYIFAVKIVGLKKTEKRANMQALCRQPSTAKVSLPSAADGEEATWQETVSWEADLFGQFANSG